MVLTFNEDLFEGANHALQVTDESGEDVTTGEVRAGADTPSVDLGPLADGAYTVTWQVVSIDSHSIGDSYQFGVGEGVVLAEDDHDSETDYRNQQNIDPLVLVIVGCIVVAVGLVAFLIVMRRRTSSSQGEGPASPTNDP